MLLQKELSLMKTQPEPFQYRFVAVYRDGTSYEQTADDVSVSDPTKSAYFDVKQDKIVNFYLIKEDDSVVAGVDLQTGLFSINGHDFWAAPSGFVKVNPLRLVYFRETRVEVTMDGNIDGKVLGTKHYVSRYFIGWETEDRFRKTVQQTIAVA